MVAGCGTKCVKYLFFTFNFLVFLCGAAILGVALWARFDPNFSNLITKGWESSGNIPAEIQNIHIVLYVMMGIGGALMLCGGLGCVGACCESPCLLGTFFTIILILFLAEIAGAIYIFVKKDAIKNDFNQWFKDNLVGKYNSNGDIQKFMDQTQRDFQCCGANGCDDYRPLAPDSCACSTQFGRQGCVDKLVNMFKSNITVVAIVLASLVVVELLAMIFSCILCSSMRYE